MDAETKRCPRCREEKPTGAFGTRAGTGRPTAWCRSCKKAYDRDWYRRNKQRHAAAVSRLNAHLRVRNRRLIERAKDVACADCHKRYPTFVMDFDHVRGEKVANVSHLAGIGASEETLRAEIAKCDVVCANCHRERTHGGPGGVKRADSSVAEPPSSEHRQLPLAFERRASYRLAG